MSKKVKALLFSIILSSIGGCSSEINRTLSPPSDTKWIYVEVKNPSQFTQPFSLEVRYLSKECLKQRVSGFDGSTITEPSYNVIEAPLHKQVGGDIWTTQVAMNGGGSCKWTLSAISLGIEYINATHLEKDLIPGTAAGATIAFDDDASSNGQYVISVGDINLSPKYFPYIRERKIGGRKNTLSLFGKEDFISIRALNSNKIVFSPILDEKKVIRFVGVEKKIKGAYPKIIYPDGSSAPERTLFPDFDKVDKM